MADFYTLSLKFEILDFCTFTLAPNPTPKYCGMLRKAVRCKLPTF